MCHLGLYIATVRNTITLTDQQDSWIKSQIDAGHFTNDSECIRGLIRREQERRAELDVLRAALIEGEISDEPRGLTLRHSRSVCVLFRPKRFE